MFDAVRMRNTVDRGRMGFLQGIINR